MTLSYFNHKTVTIKRQTYTGNKSALTTVATRKAYFRPLTEEQSAANGLQFGQGHALLFDKGADIKETDTVTIDGQDYTVVGVADHERFGIPHKRAVITKPQKQ